jgi:hypothetical protein
VRNQIQFEPPYPLIYITPYDQIHSLGMQLGDTALSDVIYPAANRAVYIPFVLYRPATAYKMFLFNGAVVSGNIDLGIYDKAGVRLASIGSTVQAGTSNLQEVAFASPVQLGPGYYFMAMSMDNITGQVLRRALGNNEGQAAGQYQQGSAFPLPATATLNALSSSYIPLIGVKFYDV